MKKILLLAACTFSLFQANNANAQYQIDTKEFRFGAFIAPTLSWMRPSSKTDDQKNYANENGGSKVGFTYGIMAEYYFTDNYAFVTGLQMTSGGGKINQSRVKTEPGVNIINKANFDYNINYLEIPVALKLRTDDINGLRFFGQAGLTLGINVGKKAAYDLEYYDENGDFKTISKEKDKLTSSKTLGTAVAPVMLSMTLGAGVEIPMNDKISGYAGIFFNNGFAPDATSPQNYELYNGINNKIGVNSEFKDGNVRFNNIALRIGIYF